MAFWLEKPFVSSADGTSDHKNNYWAHNSSSHRKLSAEEQRAALHQEICTHPSLPEPTRAPTSQGPYSFGVTNLKQLGYSSWENVFQQQNGFFVLH